MTLRLHRRSPWKGALLALLCAVGPVRTRAAGDDFFADPALSHFQIEIAAANLAKLRQDPRSYVRAEVTVGPVRLSGVAVRLKGFGSFRPVDDRPSFAMKFDHFSPDQKFHGLTKLMLNNSTQDPTLLSEHLASGLFRDAGVPSARVTHARVSLNGRDLGLYVAVEAMNRGFLRRHFSDPRGNLYEAYAKDLDQRLDQDSGPPGDQSDLRALVEAARAPVAERPAALRRVLDVERFASFLAVTMFIAQHDSYPLNRNNYRLYRDPASGRFVMLPHGCDGTLSRFGLPVRPPLKYLLTRAVLEIPEANALYLERFRALFTAVFKLDLLTSRVEAAGKRLEAAAADEAERASIATRTASFLQRLKRRHESVARQLAGKEAAPLALARGAGLQLTDWSPEVGSGTAALAKTRLADAESLHLKITGPGTAASWRKSLLLAPGRYRFTARARAAGVSSARGEPGAGVRISGERSARRLLSTETWTLLEHSFTVREGEEDVQLVCELRGGEGEAWFESDSLRLLREEDAG